MFDNINLQYSWWSILLCIVVALIFSFALYARDKKLKEYPKIATYFLGMLRFLSVFGISILLLNPLIKKYAQEVQKPIVVIAEDISKSISFKNPAVKDSSHQNLLKITQNLSKTYNVQHLRFGERVLSNEQDSTIENASNISSLFHYLSEHYSSDNIGAIILSTDGIYNEGINPLYQPSKLAVPIYSIGLGDTVQSKDLLIKNVYHNKIAYLGNDFTTQIDLQSFNNKDQNTKLEVYKISAQSARKKVYEKSIHINKNIFFNTYEVPLKADLNGVNHYRISVKPLKGELTYDNNTKDIFVDVLDLKQKILILTAAPHPDITTLKSLVADNENYEIEVQQVSKVNKAKLNNYDLIIFHNLPNSTHSLDTEIAEINKLKIPRFFIVGASVNKTRFNQIQDCIEILGNSNSNSEIQGIYNNNFNSFILEPDFHNQIGRFPPLINSFGDYKLLPGSNVLLHQKISNFKTKYPLLAFKEVQGIKTGVLAGEGIWKWKFYEFLENKNNDILNILLRKTFQYLTIKNDKRKLRIETSKNIYKQTESIVINAQLFNDNYELINDPEVNIAIKDQDGKQYDFVFSRIEDYYILDAKQLPAGSYHYTASTLLNGVKLSQKGRFSVKSLQLELFDLTANHNILRQLSNQSNGRFYYPNQSASLITDINNNKQIKPLIFHTEKSEPIINYKWILGLLILLLTVEWFIRRYLGTY